jgi:uncharacterized protein YjbI with pentapeptide repeats
MIVFAIPIRLFALVVGALVGAWPSLAGEHLGADQVRAIVVATQGQKIDLSGQDMSGDDLTGLDLSGANLTRADLSNANLHGVKLLDANLTETSLVNADLTFAWIMRANFTRANLHGATLQTVVTSLGMENTRDQAASFIGADLSNTHTTVHFSFDDMHGANFSRANMTVVMANQSMGLLRTEFNSCNLDGANFEGAGLGHVTFRFARLHQAIFRNADLRDADFIGAYLNGSDFTGAQTDRADFDSATLTDVTGLKIPSPR